MPEYELLAAREILVQSYLALADVQASLIAIYLSMIFAYTTVAYVVGKQLSKLQVFLATFIYFIASIYMAANIVVSAAGIIEYQKRLVELVPDGGGALSVEAVASMFWIESVLWPTLMIAPLVFMWQVRSTK